MSASERSGVNITFFSSSSGGGLRLREKRFILSQLKFKSNRNETQNKMFNSLRDQKRRQIFTSLVKCQKLTKNEPIERAKTKNLK